MSALTPFVVAIAGVFGLVIGSFLNVVAYRVPAGVSLLRESRCPRCDSRIHWHQNVPIVSWAIQAGRCASCGGPISSRYPLVELATGIFFAAAAYGVINSRPFDARPVDGALWFGTPEFFGVLLTLGVFAALTIVLTLIDLDTRRLPDAIVLPGWATIALLLFATTLASVAMPQLTAEAGAPTGSAAPLWEPFLRALVGGAALFLFYFAVRQISPRGMGGGDVKLAGLVGTVLGWFGWANLVVGAFAAFVLGGVFGILLILTRRAKPKSAIPFGPWMLAGAWVGIIVGDPIGRWYLGLYS